MTPYVVARCLTSQPTVLALNNENDSLKSRWKTHPMWDALSNVNWGSNDFKPYEQPTKHRAPQDEFLFVNGLGAITSFMARENIDDFSEGFGEYIAAAIEFHDGIIGNSIDKYIRQKIREKQKRFNTKNNNPDNGVTALERLEQAEAYCKARDGD